MKTALLLVFLLLTFSVFSQEDTKPFKTGLEEAFYKSESEDKPLLLYLGRHPDTFLDNLAKNDTLAAVLNHEFVNYFHLSGKERRYLQKRYDVKQLDFILLEPDQSLQLKIPTSELSEMIQYLAPHARTTMNYYTEEYKRNFIKTDSSQIHDVIQTTFLNSSSHNARNLTMEYLHHQESLLTPINYQLIKTMMPMYNPELLHRFLSEMRPEMYTQEMAEKVAYELLAENRFSVSTTKKVIQTYDIPFQDEINLYLDLYNSRTFRAKKENCYEYVVNANTSDFKSLSSCFTYILKNGTKKQIKEVELTYMFMLNEVPIQRSLLYGELLGELYLSQGEMNKFLSCQMRNERIREKFLVNYQPKSNKK